MIQSSAASLCVACVLLFLSACVAPPAPRETFFRLDVVPAAAYPRPPLPGVLEVDRVETEGVLSERAIAYQAGKGALRRYAYDFWSEAPGPMLGDVLARELRRARVAATVVTPDLRVPPDWLLRARLTRFEQLPAAGKVVAALQVAVTGAGHGALLLQKAYAAEAATADDSPEAAAAAMGRAVSDIVARLVADFSEVKP